MMLCKDCVHYEVCKDYVESALDGLQYNDSQMNGDDCEFFKGSSRFVELPRVGDKVYELCRINQFGDYKIDESEIKGFIVDTDGTAFDYDLMGKRFFLTREDAEQALKERENDEKKNDVSR